MSEIIKAGCCAWCKNKRTGYFRDTVYCYKHRQDVFKTMRCLHYE